MKRNQRQKPARRAFTLVELLTVIVIIGILVGLISAAVFAALKSARSAAVSLEIYAMDRAMKQFRDTYGDYPPSNMTSSNSDAVASFLRRAFPRYAGSATNATLYSNFCSNVQSACGVNPGSLDAAGALVFWLGGLPDSTGKLTGFATDVENPFQSPAVVASRTKCLFDFQTERLSGMRYYPNISGAEAAGANCPYVYYRWNDYYATSGTHAESGGTATLRPYRKRTTANATDDGEFANPESFQIISAGLDNAYGAFAAGTGDLNFPIYPASSTATSNFTAIGGQIGHYDNLTNFTEGRLEDAAK
jgi:prepilin-type N-terminal cleavage/methylation domain-containing protein